METSVHSYFYFCICIIFQFNQTTITIVDNLRENSFMARKIRTILPLTLLALAVFTPLLSRAEFGAEPYLGYTVAGGMSHGGTNWGTYSGVGFGGRLTYYFAGLAFAGVDVSYYLSLAFNPTAASNIGRGETSNFKAGAVAGVSLFAIPLRLWVGFNPWDQYNSNNESLSGFSFKFGAGYQFLPFISANLEYFITSAGTAQGGSPKQNLNLGTDRVDGQTVLLSLSVPLKAG